MSPSRNPFRRRPRRPRPYPHHNDDTAPFDVAALLAALDNDDLANADDNDNPSLATDHGTHYYGDDCPGGHLNNGAADPDDYRDLAAYYGRHPDHNC